MNFYRTLDPINYVKCMYNEKKLTHSHIQNIIILNRIYIIQINKIYAIQITSIYIIKINEIYIIKINKIYTIQITRIPITIKKPL